MSIANDIHAIRQVQKEQLAEAKASRDALEKVEVVLAEVNAKLDVANKLLERIAKALEGDPVTGIEVEVGPPTNH